MEDELLVELSAFSRVELECALKAKNIKYSLESSDQELRKLLVHHSINSYSETSETYWSSMREHQGVNITRKYMCELLADKGIKTNNSMTKEKVAYLLAENWYFEPKLVQSRPNLAESVENWRQMTKDQLYEKLLEVGLKVQTNKLTKEEMVQMLASHYTNKLDESKPEYWTRKHAFYEGAYVTRELLLGLIKKKSADLNLEYSSAIYTYRKEDLAGTLARLYLII